MRLHIKRDQAEQKGFFGGSKGFNFSLSCRLELNEEEKALVEKYKQWEIAVHSYELDKGGTASWSLLELTNGKTVNCGGVAALISSEDEVRDACNNVKTLLDVMSSFGGEDVIEI